MRARRRIVLLSIGFGAAAVAVGAGPAAAAPPPSDSSAVGSCPATAQPAPVATPVDQTEPDPAPANEAGQWNGYWDGEDWVAVWVPDDSASASADAWDAEAADEAPATQAPPPDPGSCASTPGDPTTTPAPAAVAVPAVEQAAVAGPASRETGPEHDPVPSFRSQPTYRHGDPARVSEDTPDDAVSPARFVTRSVLAPLLDRALNPLLAFVVGAGALVLYTLLASTVTGPRAVRYRA